MDIINLNHKKRLITNVLGAFYGFFYGLIQIDCFFRIMVLKRAQ